MSTRPRFLVVAILWWLSIAALIPFGRPIVNALRERNLLGVSVTLGLLLSGGAAILWVALMLRKRALRPRQVMVAVIATVALLALAQLLERAEERWHIVQYGILGVLLWGAMARPGRSRAVIAILAILITGALGWADEGVQYLLPDRVYDLRDILLNGLSGAIGVGVAEGVRLLGGKERGVTQRKGVPLVVSAPSGAGKTTLCRHVMELLDGLEFSVSHTTRPLRGKEQEGVDYHFVADKTFDQMIADEAFLEWAPVHAQRYGTARGPVSEKLERGIDVLFDIDVQGGRQIAERMDDAVLVFVLPPSMAVLEQRLRGRESDTEEQIQKRLGVAQREMQEGSFYTYWIVNDDLQVAIDELRAIILAERLRRCDNRALVRRVTGGEK